MKRWLLDVLSIGELSTRSEPTTERKEGRMEEKKLPQRLVRDAGVFYVCHRLSQMGWNARPSMRYAKGPNVVIDSEDGERTLRLKVRSLSKRAGTTG
jgi:hypothetical protein